MTVVQSLESAEMIAMPAAALEAVPGSMEVDVGSRSPNCCGDVRRIEMVDKVKCLLVDDVEENLLALEALLRGDDREIYKATSGPAALELLLVHDFALALLDIHMPTMDGFELAELMRGTERSKHIPIIFITASEPNEPLPMFRGYESGAVDVLFKPINPEILRQKADVFFELHRQRRQLAQAVQRARGRARHRLARHAHAAGRGAHHDVDAAQSEIQAHARSRCASSTSASGATSIS